MNNLGAIYYPNVPFKQLYIPEILREIYIEKVYRTIFTDNKKDMVCLDVGANIGLVTQYMSEYSKVVHAIEPEPDNFYALFKNRQHNRWHNVILHNLAISNNDGIEKLALNKNNKTMHTLIVDPLVREGDKYISDKAMVGRKVYIQNSEYDDTVPVTVKRFDTFFKENNIKQVDFMKFDVEGAEEMILRHESFTSIAPLIKAMLVEFHFMEWQPLADYIITLGYRATKFNTEATIILFERV